MRIHVLLLFAAVCVLVAVCGAIHLPAYPLVTIDPLTNVWSMTDKLYEGWPRLWNGDVRAMSGYMRIDSTVYRFMYTNKYKEAQAAVMSQTRVEVSATKTTYQFEAANVVLRVSFVTPLLAHDLAILALPVTYIQYDVYSTDKEHDIQVYFDATAEWVSNSASEYVSANKTQVSPTLSCGKMGTRDQKILGLSGDSVGINWGYAYMCTSAEAHVVDVESARDAFVLAGSFPSVDDTRFPRQVKDHWPGIAMRFTGKATQTSTTIGRIMMAYDDIKSIRFFERDMEPYWRFLYGGSVDKMLNDAWTRADDLMTKCAVFDKKNHAEMLAAGGEEYAALGDATYRQVLASTKLVRTPEGKVWYFLKEISSNGDLGTVDVIYPTYPFYLTHNPALLFKAIEPLLAYSINMTNPDPAVASKYAWPNKFGPHHLGTYPVAQIMPKQQENMPVESCADLLIMIQASLEHKGCSLADVAPYKTLMKTFADYLVSVLPDPGNQLCSDDFMGKSAHNTNLALKGIVGLHAYAKILEMHGTDPSYYTSQAEGFYKQWKTLAWEVDHSRLQFDLHNNTWSLKYNWFPAYAMGLELDREVVKTDMKHWLKMSGTYGPPLDSRKFLLIYKVAKWDWSLWCTAIALASDDAEMRAMGSQMLHQLFVYADSTPSHVPLSDWYDIGNAKQISFPKIIGFKARPVVGGLYAISLLHNRKNN